MSFIAAVLILNLDTADAFIAFSNLLNKPCQMAFFRVDHGLVSICRVRTPWVPCSYTARVAQHFVRRERNVFSRHAVNRHLYVFLICMYFLICSSRRVSGGMSLKHGRGGVAPAGMCALWAHRSPLLLLPHTLGPGFSCTGEEPG